MKHLSKDSSRCVIFRYYHKMTTKKKQDVRNEVLENVR